MCRIISGKTLIYLIVAVVLILPAEMRSQTNAGYAGSFLRLGLGAKGIARANTAPTGDADAYGFFYNPASLPGVTGYQAGTAFGFLPLDRVYHYLGGTMALPPSAGIGFGWLSTGVNDIQGRNFNGEKTQMYTVRQNTFLIGFGNRFSKYFQVGALFKIMRNDLQELDATGVALDIGAIVRPIPPLSLGVMASNINGEFSWDTEDVYSQGTTRVNKIPIIMRIGATVQVLEGLRTMVEYERSRKGAVVYRGAAEWQPLDIAVLRAGIADTDIRFGGGLEYGFIGDTDTALDYAIAFGRAGEGTSHYFSWSFRF